MSMKWMGHLIERINSSSEGWAEALQAELVLLRVYINMAFGGDRREFVFSALALHSQPVALLLLDSCKLKPWPLTYLNLGGFFAVKML